MFHGPSISATQSRHARLDRCAQRKHGALRAEGSDVVAAEQELVRDISCMLRHTACEDEGGTDPRPPQPVSQLLPEWSCTTAPPQERRT